MGAVFSLEIAAPVVVRGAPPHDTVKIAKTAIPCVAWVLVELIRANASKKHPN